MTAPDRRRVQPTESRPGRRNRRRGVAAAILLAWVAGLGLLARREYFRPASDRLREAALRVMPGAVYFAVTQGDAHIGFASSTVDTTNATDTSVAAIEIEDYFVADLPVAGKLRRTAARSIVRLTRGLALTDFTVQVQSEAGPFGVRGWPTGDSLLTIVISTGDGAPDTTRMTISGPVLLPTLVPLAVALGERPRVGRSYTLAVFDPMALGPRDVTVRVQAESLFVVADSAAFDTTTRRWRGAREDTVRAWKLASTASGSGFSGWVDRNGRLVEIASPLGMTAKRSAYELAFENWRADNARRPRRVTADRDILENTAIGAGERLRDREYDRLVVRLGNVDLAGYDLQGERQTLRGNTLVIQREARPLPEPGYRLPAADSVRARFGSELAPEPLLQSEDWDVVRLAARIAAGETDPRVVAERINRWVHDSLAKEITVGIPNALQVMRVRKGDCNEHTQLYLALARASGLPARSAAGLAYVDGKFYYHAWPEVWLGRWVAVDPTFGEFPADAAHLRFVIGGLNRQAELLRLMGALTIDVAQAR